MTIGVITNARAAGQRSMIGYGELVLEAAHATGAEVVEWRGVSLGRGTGTTRRGSAKLVGQIERFVLSPLALAGRRAAITHVVDPGNAIYLDATRQDASIVTVHDVIPYLCLRGELSGFRPSTTGRWLMRRILHRLSRVDRIVCVSEATRRDLLRIADIDPARVSVIHNAVFHSIEATPPQARRRLRAELGLPKDAPVVLHIGRNFYKNRAVVVQAFARLRAWRPDAHLLMVGPLTPDLEEAIAVAGVAEAVRLAPYIAPANMAALYGLADVLLFPSLYEGFGYPVLEAQLAGTPVICSDRGALPEVAGQGARLFPPDDAAGMAAAALELIDDPAAAAALVAKGRANAGRFDRGAWFDAHAAIYAELAGRGVTKPVQRPEMAARC